MAKTSLERYWVTKMEQIAIDIETAPLDNAGDMFDESAVKVGNLKDPEKIKAKIEQAREEFVDKAALNWTTGRITCICLKNDDTEDKLLGSEEEILRNFWQAVDGYQIITYNGHSFDMQFIIMRSLVNGVRCNAISSRGHKYIRNIDKDMHIDLANLYDSCGQMLKLDTVAKAILGESKTGDGKQAIQLFKDGKFDELAEYCMKDAEITWKLWKVLN